MISKYEGRHYFVDVILLNTGKRHSFAIKAIDKATKRWSYVTNINWLISEVGGENKPKFWESDWTGNPREAKQWCRRIVSILQDEKYLRYLETRFDDDREAGEWKKIIGKKG